MINLFGYIGKTINEKRRQSAQADPGGVIAPSSLFPSQAPT